MATSTFERKIEITDIESARRLMKIASEEVPAKPLLHHPFSKIERDWGEELLRQCPLRSTR